MIYLDNAATSRPKPPEVVQAMTDFLKGVKGVYIVDEDQKAMVPWIGLDSGGAQSVQGGQR